MFDAIRRRLSDLMDALGGDAPVSREEMDRVLAEMREELIQHRARLRGREEEVESYRRRLEQLRGRDHVDAARLAELEARVAEREAELAEERSAVRELTNRFTEAVRRRDLLLASDRRTRASETVRQADRGAADEFDRLEVDIEDEARELAARRELERDLEGPDAEADPGVERALEEAEAEELLRRLKRELGEDE